MRIKSIMIIAALLFSFAAEAKVYFNSAPMGKQQIDAVTGFLYETIKNRPAEIQKIHMAQAARAVAWLKKLHEKKESYEILSFKTDQASFIRASVFYIAETVNSKDSTKEKSKILINHWTSIGKRVVAKYKEKNGKLISGKLILKKGKKNEANKR